ncbi:MAG TPA: hypothetical protein VLH18_06730, partial [Candidatus Limnocylindrales bacterium]|nr:hypothetical protein [Candidatus Limnocylindrales bacterium]
VYLPQRAENSREEFADGFHIQYGTLHGWGEYEISVWACTQEINALEWRRFIQAVEQAGGSIDMDEKALET